MKAPKKIYLHPTAKGEVGANWLTFPLTDEDAEYVRTDALIEKTCAYLDSIGHRYIIDAFRKYMKE